MTTPTPPPDSAPKRKRHTSRGKPPARRDRRPQIRLQPAQFVPMTPEQETEAVAILARMLAATLRSASPPPGQPPADSDHHDQTDPDERD